MTYLDDALRLVRIELSKVILQDLAEELGFSYGCLYSIREGKTQWPRKKTMDKLLPMLGLKMEICYEQKS